MGRKMEKNKLNTLLIGVLTLSLLVGCADQIEPPNASNTSPSESANKTAAPGSINSLFSDFVSSFHEFKESIPKQADNIDNTTLDDLNKKLNKVKNNFDIFNKSSQESLSNKNIEDINSNLEKIILVVGSLKDTSNSENVKNCQNLLLKQGYQTQKEVTGNFGKKTKENLLKFLTENNSTVSNKIESLTTQINQKITQSDNSLPPLAQQTSDSNAKKPNSASSPSTSPKTSKSSSPESIENKANFLWLIILSTILMVSTVISIIAISGLFNLEKKVKELEKLEKRKPKANQEHKESDRQVLDKVDELTRQVNILRTQLSNLEDRSSTNKTYSPPGNYTSSSPTNQLDRGIPQQPVRQPSVSPYLKVVQDYNSDPNSLLKNAIKVSETEESISRRRSDSSQPVILGKESNGNYWVLTGVSSTDWLVPKINLSIDPYNIETVYSLFTCNGQPEYSHKLTLLKPARVSRVSGRDEWQLEERGELQFI